MLATPPDIVRGIKTNPLPASKTTYSLWLDRGSLPVVTMLAVNFRHPGEMYGRGRCATSASRSSPPTHAARGDADRRGQRPGRGPLPADRDAGAPSPPWSLIDGELEGQPDGAFPEDRRGLDLALNAVAGIVIARAAARRRHLRPLRPGTRPAAVTRAMAPVCPLTPWSDRYRSAAAGPFALGHPSSRRTRRSPRLAAHGLR